MMKLGHCANVGMILAGIAVASGFAQTVTVVNGPDRSVKNNYYVSHREPLKPAAFL